MPLVKTCPPHCGTVLQASIGYWLLAHMGGVVTAIGALGLLALTVKLISPTHTVDFFAITAVGIAIMYFGAWRVRLGEAQSSVNR